MALHLVVFLIGIAPLLLKYAVCDGDFPEVVHWSGLGEHLKELGVDAQIFAVRQQPLGVDIYDGAGALYVAARAVVPALDHGRHAENHHVLYVGDVGGL